MRHLKHGLDTKSSLRGFTSGPIISQVMIGAATSGPVLTVVAGAVQNWRQMRRY